MAIASPSPLAADEVDFAAMASTEEDVGDAPPIRHEISDGCFRCHFCEKVIEDDEAVYMCRDASYCSASCRRRGRHDAATGGFARTFSGSIFSTIDSAMSESSRSSSSLSRSSLGATAAVGGVIGWLIGKVSRRLASMVKGAELLRNLSSQAVRTLGISSLGDASGLSGAPGAAGSLGAQLGAQELERKLSEELHNHFDGEHSPEASSDFVRLIEG